MSGIVIDMLRHLIKEESPMVKAFSLDRWVAAWEAGKDPVLRGAPALVVAHAPNASPLAQDDCVIGLTLLDVAAPTMGLGACWAGLFKMAATQWPSLQQALALPEGHTFHGALMVGYPEFEYPRMPTRKEAVIDWRD